MKKSTIVIALGFFVLVTTFLGMDNNKMYQKQKHFETSSEVLQQLDNKQLKIIDKNGRDTETDELKECLSERKRLTDSQFNYGKMEIEKIEELSEKKKQSILKEYDELRNKFSKRRVITKEEVLRLDVNGYRAYRNQTNLIDTEPEKLKIDLVLVDEGEGLVIDYIMEKHVDKSTQEDNKDD